MEDLLTSYLYTYRNCPLPTVGTLLVQPGNAVAEQSEQQMFAPVPNIQFVSKENNADELLQYISSKKNIDIQQASDQLSSYCDKLQEMQPYEEIKLGSAGNFYITPEGELHFKSAEIPSAFIPSVRAERVIHPEASHQMLVGDTQTNTSTMAELLDNHGNSRRPKWIWVAAGLGLAGLIALAVYIMNRQPGNLFGNAAAVQGETAPAATYQSSGK